MRAPVLRLAPPRGVTLDCAGYAVDMMARAPVQGCTQFAEGSPPPARAWARLHCRAYQACGSCCFRATGVMVMSSQGRKRADQEQRHGGSLTPDRKQGSQTLSRAAGNAPEGSPLSSTRSRVEGFVAWREARRRICGLSRRHARTQVPAQQCTRVQCQYEFWVQAP
jgi:hypothetical protein